MPLDFANEPTTAKITGKIIGGLVGLVLRGALMGAGFFAVGMLMGAL